jgi:hypothetical protein
VSDFSPTLYFLLWRAHCKFLLFFTFVIIHLLWNGTWSGKGNLLVLRAISRHHGRHLGQVGQDLAQLEGDRVRFLLLLLMFWDRLVGRCFCRLLAAPGQPEINQFYKIPDNNNF